MPSMPQLAFPSPKKKLRVLSNLFHIQLGTDNSRSDFQTMTMEIYADFSLPRAIRTRCNFQKGFEVFWDANVTVSCTIMNNDG
jgi:hypothetical protein